MLDKIKLQQLRWLGNIQRTENSCLPKVVFHGRVHGSCPRGSAPEEMERQRLYTQPAETPTPI